MPDDKNNMPHSIIMQERKKLVFSGVCEVSSFDEHVVVIETVQGQLTIKGENLHIAGFNRETGDMQMDGKLIALAYTGDSKQSGSFFGRIFK